MLSDDDKTDKNIDVNDDNVNNNISNTINNTDGTNLSAVKTEIKLEMEALNINTDPSASADNIPLDQLVATQQSTDVEDADADTGGNDGPSDDGQVSAASVESMVVDDPEAFGPFTRSQLTATIQSEVDQMFYNSFQDQISLLETAIGLVSP